MEVGQGEAVTIPEFDSLTAVMVKSRWDVLNQYQGTPVYWMLCENFTTGASWWERWGGGVVYRYSIEVGVKGGEHLARSHIGGSLGPKG